MRIEMRALVLAAIVGGELLAISSAQAGVPPQMCKDYYKPSGDNAMVDSYLRDHPGAGMDVCQTMSGPGDIYYAIEAPKEDGQQVCKFSVVPIYPSSAPDGTVTWTDQPGPDSKRASFPRRLYASSFDAKCPGQLYAWYVGIADGFPDEKFLSVFRYVRSITSSQAAFDKAMMPLALDDGHGLKKFFKDSVFGNKPPDSVRFVIDKTGYIVTIIFYDAMFVIHLKQNDDGFIVDDLKNLVTWPGPDF